MAQHPGGEVGRRLIHVAIDDKARTVPHRPYASLPRDDHDLSKGFQDISYATMANAVNKMAYFLVDELGPSDQSQTVAFLGGPDLRYYILMFAAAKTGHCIFLPSHLNTLPMHISLMEQTETQVLLTSCGVFVSDIIRERPMSVVEIPELDDLLDAEDVVPDMPCTTSFEEAQYHPWLISQTSGTTEAPRKVTYTHGSLASLDRQAVLPDVEGRSHWTWHPKPGARYFLAASPYHPVGLGGGPVVAGFGDGILVFGFRYRPLELTDVDDVCALIKHSGVTAGFMPSNLMDAIARRHDAQELMGQFETITYGHGMLSEYGIKAWLKTTRIQCLWGSAETMSPPVLESDQGREDVSHVFFDLDASGLHFEKRDLLYHNEEGERLPLYEMIMSLVPGSARWTSRAELGLTGPAPEPPYPRYPVAEVWTPHPDPDKARYAWRFVSRLADLTPGWLPDTSQLATEKVLRQHRQVQSVMVLARPDGVPPVALVELVNDDIDPELAAAVIKADTVEPLNRALPDRARVAQTRIVAVPPGAFVRGTEGHLRRKETEEKHADIIDQLCTTPLPTTTMTLVHRPKHDSVAQTADLEAKSSPV